MNKNCPIIVASVGFVVLFMGIVCSWYAFPKLVDYEIGQQIALVEGNQVYNIWKKQPFPLKFKVYFFNVTNAPEVQLGANPIVKEVGPYIYDEYWERVNVSINEEADTITYMLKRTFFYNSKESECRTEDDVITMINGALVSTALQVYIILPSALETVNDAVPYLYKGAKDVFLRNTAREILFDGITITCHDPEVEFVCSAMKGMLPPTMEFSEDGKDFKFSLFGYMNRTFKGPFTIGRGIKNTTRGDIYEYAGGKELSNWAGHGCNMINGSDSTLFYPMKTPPERMYAFSPDICRSMFISFEKETVFQDVHTWKYTNRPESIANNDANKCFCPKVKDDDYNDVTQCPKSGLFDLTFCIKAPILASNPHFYLGDPTLLNYIQGVKPVKELHENFVYLEPITGSPISGAKRLQMNVEMKRFDDFTLLSNVTEGVFPMLWIEEGVQIPPEMKAMIVTGLSQLGILDTLKWILIVTGVIIMMSSFILVMYKERLMCFSNVGSNTVAISDVKGVNRMGVSEPISTINFNSTVLYPSLYPQVEDKNISDRLVRRNNLNQMSWQLKN